MTQIQVQHCAIIEIFNYLWYMNGRSRKKWPSELNDTDQIFYFNEGNKIVIGDVSMNGHPKNDGEIIQIMHIKVW